MFLCFVRHPARVAALWRQSRSVLNRIPYTPRPLVWRQETRIFLFLLGLAFQQELDRKIFEVLAEGFPTENDPPILPPA